MPVIAVQDIRDDALVLTLAGRIDASNADEFQKDFSERLAKETASRVVLDCAALTYVSSAGLRVFLKAIRDLRQRKGSLALCAVNPGVLEVLKIAGLTSFLRLGANVEECLKGG